MGQIQQLEKQINKITRKMNMIDLIFKRPVIIITKIHGGIDPEDLTYEWTHSHAEKRYDILQKKLSKYQEDLIVLQKVYNKSFLK